MHSKTARQATFDIESHLEAIIAAGSGGAGLPLRADLSEDLGEVGITAEKRRAILRELGVSEEHFEFWAAAAMDVERRALQMALEHAAGAFAFERRWRAGPSATEQRNAIRALKTAMKTFQATVPPSSAAHAESGFISLLAGAANIEAEAIGGFAEFPPEPIFDNGTDWRGRDAVRHDLALLQAALPASVRVETWASKAFETANNRLVNSRQEARRKEEPLRVFERRLPLAFLLFFGRQPGISTRPGSEDLGDTPSGRFLEFWLACLVAIGEPAGRDAIRSRWREMKGDLTGQWWDLEQRSEFPHLGAPGN